MPVPQSAIAIDIAKEVFKLAKEEGWLDRLRSFFKKKHVVIVLGNTGTGKTNFLDSLTQELPEAIHHLSRSPDWQIHPVQIEDQPFRFIDTPGQEGHSSRKSQGIREAISQGATGIINTVANGYHEYEIDPKKALTPSGKVREEFLELHRKAEIEALDEWTALIPASQADWLLTVVSKADLWWHKREQTLAHYRSGEYGERVRDRIRLHHWVLPHCSVVHRFYGIGPVSGHFDDAERQRAKMHLLSSLLQITAKKS